MNEVLFVILVSFIDTVGGILLALLLCQLFFGQEKWNSKAPK